MPGIRTTYNFQGMSVFQGLLRYCTSYLKDQSCRQPTNSSRFDNRKMDSQHEVNEEENEYQEYFHYVMEHEELQYPSKPQESFNLYQRLMNIVVS